MFKDFFHSDPLTLIVLLIGIIGGYYVLRDTVKRQGEWQKEHEKECNDFRKATTDNVTRLALNSEKLTAIMENTVHRVDRLERQKDDEE